MLHTILKFLLFSTIGYKSDNRLPSTRVGPCVILCQMFVNSEFSLDSALVSDSD